MYTAVVNYSAISEKINISYYLKLHSDNNHPNVLHFWILGVVSIIILIMSKIFIRQLPSTKFLVYWLIAAYTTILALFVNHKFFSCNDETNFFKNNIALKECNFNCGCEPEFEPVCLDGYTYYSACYAGCTVQNSTVSNIPFLLPPLKRQFLRHMVLDPKSGPLNSDAQNCN